MKEPNTLISDTASSERVADGSIITEKITTEDNQDDASTKVIPLSKFRLGLRLA